MNITGEQRAKLRGALVSGFPTWDDLAILVNDRLNERLQNITASLKAMPHVAQDLIVWAQARGRLTELVIGAAAENPANADLQSAAQQFRFAAAVPGEHERIVLERVPFQNVGEWLDRLARYRRAVARFEPQPADVSKADYGTGFLVAPNRLLTNFHVVAKLLTGEKKADKVVVRFDYEVDKAGQEVSKGREARLAADWDRARSPVEQFDFALVELADAPGEDAADGGKRGFIPITDPEPAPAKGEPIMILQHPDALPLKLSIGSVDAPADVGAGRIAYTANTLGGSSGSPCFSAALDPVALHHWGGTAYNRGIRLSAILEHLGEPGRRLLG